MNDNKIPDDDFFDDSFEDEFGEEAAEPAPSIKSSSTRAGKWLVGAAAVASIVSLTGYFGYKFYASKTELAVKTPSLPASTQAKSTLPNQTVPFPPGSSVSSKQAPKLAPLPTQQNATAGASSKKENGVIFSEDEMAALMKSDVPKATTAPSSPAHAITTAVSKDNVIPQQQKELFGIHSTDAPSKMEQTASKPIVELPDAKQPHSLVVSLTKETFEKETPVSASAPPPFSVEDLQQITQQLNTTMAAITKANQQMENNLNQIKYLDAYTREVSLTVEKLNTQITAMDNRIVALNNLANSLSKDLNKVRNEVGYAKRLAGDDGLDIPSAPRKSRTDTESMYLEEGLDFDNSKGYRKPKAAAPVGVVMDEPEFVVHAVIPGRAWLKSSKGQIITLTEGEIIGNYGKILVIDAANGVVLTSSGVTFR
jgi:hypothetical protein